VTNFPDLPCTHSLVPKIRTQGKDQIRNKKCLDLNLVQVANLSLGYKSRITNNYMWLYPEQRKCMNRIILLIFYKPTNIMQHAESGNIIGK
jgi:hypothetical protein